MSQAMNNKDQIHQYHQPNAVSPSNPKMVLTTNIISSMINGDIFRYPIQILSSPVVQVFYINDISQNKQNQFSYCIVIFDGVKRAPVFVDNSLNGFITSGLIIKGSIIKLLDFRPFTSNHLKTITVMKMVVLKHDGFPTSIYNDNATNGKPHSCNNGTMGNGGVTLPIQTNYLPLESSSTGEPKMEQPATNSSSLESNDNNIDMSVNDSISEATQSILTTGAISKIAKGHKDKNLIVQVVHTFQCIEEKQFMFISDGLHMQIAVLAQSQNHLMLSGKLKTGSVVQLVEYTCPTPHNGMQMIVVRMEVKIFENEFIGEPKLYVEPAPNLEDGKKLEDLTKDKETSFFMHQPHLFVNHQDFYLANKTHTAIRGDTVSLAPPSMIVDVTTLVGEVEMLQLEINRLHVEKRREREKHEGEVLRLKLEMKNEQKKYGDQISQLKSEIVKQYRQTENLIKVMKKELEAVKRMSENKEVKDGDTKTNEYDEELGASFDKLDEELERIWL